MNIQQIKTYFAKLRYFPIHPQWFVFHQAKSHYNKIAAYAEGMVLDVGCADQYIQKYLSSEQTYIGLDYYATAVEWYGTRPQVYGDAQALPVADNSVETVLLLDVLEHLPQPKVCLQEIARVLKPGGKLILQVPFLYPLHDTPLDFQRWTHYGLQQIATQVGLYEQKQWTFGQPLETAALLGNIALSKIVLNWLKQKNFLFLLGIIFGIFLLPTMLLINVLAYMLTLVSPADDMMPYSYCLILEKQ